METTRLVLFAVAGSAIGGFLVGGTADIGQRTSPPTEAEVAAAPSAPLDPSSIPVVGEVGPLFAPIWTRGRISGFVAAELTLEFAPGTAQAAVLPPVQDRILSVLYRAGSEGRLDPGRTDPESLRAEMLAAARTVAAEGSQPAEVRDLRIGKLIHQENRRQ